MAIFFDAEADAKNSINARTQVWIGFECPFKSTPATQVMCGNWCALFEEESYEGSPAVGSETRKRATLKCGCGTKTYAEVVQS